jgi:hypothetical protein
VDSYSGPYQNQTGSDGIGDTPHVIDGNNKDNYPLVQPWAPPDVAVLNVTASKTVVGQGFSVDVNVTVANFGNKVEGFTVIAYGSTSNVRIQVVQPPVPWRFVLYSYVTLNGNSTAEITFTWNTSDFAKGSYNVSGFTEELPDEVNMTNNSMTGGWVIVAMVGDITGPTGWPEGQVDIRDVALVSKLYGLTFSDPGYKPNCDIDNTGEIDIKDVAIVSKNYGMNNP